jgi:chloramphenicol 3-O-phosphotransferase
MSDLPKPTVVLITGYARAGKDTLCEGMSQASKAAPIHINFASFLKAAADSFLNHLEIDETFENEQFKVKHRDTLVALGKFARSINRDVFADQFVALAQHYQRNCSQAKLPVRPIICSDWRYTNEYQVVRHELMPTFRVITVRVNTLGIEAANEEEGLSIGEITREIPLDYEFTFKPDSKNYILKAGEELARTIGL